MRREKSLNPSSRHTTVPFRRRTGDYNVILEVHGESLSKNSSYHHYKEESLPKFIEPYSLDDLLWNPIARGET